MQGLIREARDLEGIRKDVAARTAKKEATARPAKAGRSGTDRRRPGKKG